ncbi:MAG: ATP synthase subunit I [Steroidobacteraceae bacterium]
MSEFLFLSAALLGGLLLGGFFFGGLWWTVSRGMASARPALWFLGSLLLRMGVTMAGFYVLGREDWRRWLLCLAGFISARLIMNFLPRPTHLRDHRTERGYAP